MAKKGDALRGHLGRIKNPGEAPMRRSVDAKTGKDKLTKCCPARDRSLDGVPAGRRATATAGGKRDTSPTLRDLVRAAAAEGATVKVSLEPEGSTRYEIAPGRYVQIHPVGGHELVFGRGNHGVRLEIRLNAAGEYIFELTQDGKIIGQALLAEHLQIR